MTAKCDSGRARSSESLPLGEGDESAWDLESSAEQCGRRRDFACHPSGLDWTFPGSPHDGLPAMVELGPGSGSVSRRGDGITVGDAKADTERPAFGRDVCAYPGPRGKGPLGANPPCKFPQPLAGWRSPHATRLVMGNTQFSVFIERTHNTSILFRDSHKAPLTRIESVSLLRTRLGPVLGR